MILNLFTSPAITDMRTKPNDDLPAPSYDEAFMARLFEVLLEKAFDSQYSVPKLCRELGVSSSQLHRKVTAIAGISVIEIITSMRLERAKQLLRNESQRTIADIAYDCGFQDPDYFSRAFSRRFGIAPSRFRKQL